MRAAAPLLACLALPAAAALPAEGLALDAGHRLVQADSGWTVRSETGEADRPLRVPALVAESAVAVRGRLLAYVSHTRYADRFMLGCVLYNWQSDTVIARQDERIFRSADAAAAPTANATADDPAVAFDGEDHVSCRLTGEQCKPDFSSCTPVRGTVALGPAAQNGRHGKRSRKNRHPAGSASHR